MDPQKVVKLPMYDNSLIPRVKQYLEENVHQTYVDVGVMARVLQDRYREYTRRKSAPFRQLVEEAYKTVLHSYGLDSNASSEENENSDLEMMDDRPDHMNNVLTNMYGNNKASPALHEGELIDISSDDSDDDEIIDGMVNVIADANKNPIKKAIPVRIPQVTVPAKKPQDGIYTNASAVCAVTHNIPPSLQVTAHKPTKNDMFKNDKPPTGTVIASFGGGGLGPVKKRKAEDHNVNNDTVKVFRTSSPVPIKLPKKPMGRTESQTPTSGATAQVNGPIIPPKTSRKYKKEIVPQQSHLKFKDVGGIDKILKELCELMLHIKHPELYRHIGLPPPRGFLLHGPPGCGKTLLARAIAGQLDVCLIHVTATELVAGVSGESEERIRETFEQAAAIAPCVLFIDEIDVISSNRQNAQKDMERRIVAQLLSSLDGLSNCIHGDQVLVIGATNRPDALDPALRRVGRFDQEISLGIPDRPAREHILRVICAKLLLQQQFDYDAIAALTPGYVGADLLALATRAASIAVKRAFSAKDEPVLKEKTPITIPTVNIAEDSLFRDSPVENHKQSDNIALVDLVDETLMMDVDGVVSTNVSMHQEVPVVVNGNIEMEPSALDAEKVVEEILKMNDMEGKESNDLTIVTETKTAEATPTETTVEADAENVAQIDVENVGKVDAENVGKVVADTTEEVVVEHLTTAETIETPVDTNEADANKADVQINIEMDETSAVEEVKGVDETNVISDDEMMATPINTDEVQPDGIVNATDINRTVKADAIVDLDEEEEEDCSTTDSTPVTKWSLTLDEMLNWLSNDNPPIDEAQLKNLSITMGDFYAAVKLVQPSAKREGFLTVPDVTWDDIGSLRDIREELQLAVLAPVKFPHKLQELGLQTPSGVLLCGPPGCGKTLLAKAVANEAGINFISVKGPELLNMYVGESERAVRQCFQRARNSAPCVIFFDEFDALCPTRSGSSENNASSRVVNQLLTEMDGIEDRRGVFLMAATNRPDIVDPAVLRPGRLDKILYVGLPEEKDRIDILLALTKNKPKLATDVDIAELAALTNSYTGADLAGLVRQAALQALKCSISVLQPVINADEPLAVNRNNFMTAMSQIRPSVSDEDKRHYAKLRQKYATAAVV